MGYNFVTNVCHIFSVSLIVINLFNLSIDAQLSFFLNRNDIFETEVDIFFSCDIFQYYNYTLWDST